MEDNAGFSMMPTGKNYICNMKLFVKEQSGVREIWGQSDTILLIFAGASAEFALNKAVDWLYFTGRLPADPLARLFSTVSYSRQILLSENEAALRAIDKITSIHSAVEKNRGDQIPDWAYRDVLFMLIDYSIRSFELVQRKLSLQEKEEVFRVFYRVGERMGLKGLPVDYDAWLQMRNEHLQNNVVKSEFTVDLYKQYKKHLGAFRYLLLLEGQKLVVPKRVKELLRLNGFSVSRPLLGLYKLLRRFKMDWFFKSILLPTEYIKEVRELDVVQK